MNPTYLIGIFSFTQLSSAEKSCWKIFSNTASIHLIHLQLNGPYPWTLKGSQKLKDELASRRGRNSCRWSTTPSICILVWTAPSGIDQHGDWVLSVLLCWEQTGTTSRGEWWRAINMLYGDAFFPAFPLPGISSRDKLPLMWTGGHVRTFTIR